jgi:hypothetical protein
MSVMKNISYIVYIVGLFPLAFLITYLEEVIGDSWWVVVIAIVYLLILRGLGGFLSKRM